MLMYAFYTEPKPRSQPLRRMAETIIGIYLGATVYSVLESPEDKEAFLKLVPGSSITLYIYALFVGAACLCYIPGLFVYDVTQALFVVLLINTVFVDANVHYWTHKRGLDFWNQIRILSDGVTVLMGVGMVLSCSKKVLPLTEEELRQHEQRERAHED